MVDTKTSAPQMAEFLWGIETRSGKVRLYIQPMIQVTRVGKNTRIALSSKTVSYPVTKLV